MTAHTDSGSLDWYRSGIIYEVAVHSFQDSNADGIGDIPGLTSRLDYLAWLGVDVVWMLPVFPSPMRDGGYDVSDFTSIRPDFGTIDDMRTLLAEAHRRGMRVITDFIVNHTSDQHPWFQEARDPSSPKHDWYVWSDDPARYGDARVIFVDTHDSNWAWDDVAGMYYWHRFFDHQPDLNYENPEVREAMLDAIGFWLSLGVDGLRLDAVPYLFEEEGTSCENLPATHAFLKEIRAMVDRAYPEAILLAEANQLPEDLVPYFGEGDECHMAYNFPIMPRLFLAAAYGDVGPVAATIEATPTIPNGAQWAVFLRNHDELTLEMVTDEERAALYAAYAPDPAMRKNIGIRRRLAPLLDDDRRKIELLHAVLLSLPGTPVLYYGDEIGMGDNHLLDDRNGLRTPMQWDSSPSAGWSEAPPQSFYLPLIADVAHAPRSINVADQRSDPESLLSTLRAMIATRPASFGTAAFTLCDAPAGVLAYERGSITVLANFTDADVAIPCDAARLLAGTATMRDQTCHLGPYGWAWVVVQDQEPS